MKNSVEDLIAITGRIEKVIYQNAENGYSVFQIKTSDPDPAKNAELIIVVGHFPVTQGTSNMIFYGKWQEHAVHGRQFQTISCEHKQQNLPVEKFLTEYIQGVGPSYAKKLMQAFGDQLTEVLNETPERLKEVPGVGKQRYQQIVTSWQQQKSSHQIILFLTSHGLNFSQAAKIYKRYGQQTVAKVKENPYRLFKDIEGIGFQTADGLALKLQFPTDDPRRLEGGLIFIMQQAIRDGHCGMQRNDMLTKTAILLNLSEFLIESALQTVCKDQILVADKVDTHDCVFMPLLWQQEQLIAQGLKNLLATPVKNEEDIVKIVDDIVQEANLPLTEEQQHAILQALSASVFVLTGGPGVGKTTLIKMLTQVFAKQKLTFALAAPTGRAAKRISESTGAVAKTIHRLLEYDPFSQTFGFHATFPLPFDVIIVDEASMLDVPLCASIVAALPKNGRIIFVGDVDQLSAVGPGDVLKSLIGSGVVPFYALKAIFRQAATSQIIVNAHRVNQGLMPQIDKQGARDFYLIKVLQPLAQQQKITEIVTQQLPQKFGFDPLLDIQVLTPMNGGPIGVYTLNTLLQQELNPAQPDKIEVNHMGGLLRVGDKVIQIVNNYEKNIFNGDVGKISRIEYPTQKAIVIFDKLAIEYQFKELDQLRLAYAISVHKAQGSEYPAIVVVLSMSQKIMLKRNLLYTAITRGKSCVVVVGEPQALICAVQRGFVAKRINKLKEWLQDDNRNDNTN